MIEAANDSRLKKNLLCNYFTSLVNSFFKILPIRESEEKSLGVYMRSLQIELIGCGSFIDGLDENANFLSLLSILQFLIDNPTTTVKEVKREVFRAISICNKLRDSYTSKEDGDDAK